MSIGEKIAQIKGRKYGGSSTKDGKLYHSLPFDDLAHYRRHRGGTKERIENILNLIDVKDKTILDLGCSVGGMSFGMFQNNAKYVLGIDYDKESIDVANEVKNKYKCQKTEFINNEITIEIVKELPEFDIILWLSQWMWSIKQRGLEYAKELLFEVSKKGKVMIFESAAQDGMAKIQGATQNDIEKWLFENTVYERIKRTPSTGGWMKRDVFLCSHPLPRIESTRRAATSIIERIARDKIKKQFRTYPKNCIWMKAREAKALKLLERYNHYPKLIEEGDDYIVMSFVGRRNQVKFDEMKLQALEILKELKEVGITHRDIVRKNFLSLNGILYLIDFGWCVFKDEDITKARKHRNLPQGSDKEQLLFAFER